MSNITVYSTPFCAPCERLKQYLTQRGITFTDKDLMMDQDVADHLDSLGIRSAPVLEIDGQFYTGSKIAPDALPELLGIK